MKIQLLLHCLRLNLSKMKVGKALAHYLFMSLLVDCLVQGHPQCLDFRPPFDPEAVLPFCSNYSSFGCCSMTDDSNLREKYLALQRKLTSVDWNRCHGYIGELLCQRCSPYAAHVYDAERTMLARSFPGLCSNYCHEFFQACSNVIQLVDQSFNGSRLLLHADSFCAHVSLTDTDYCYPDLLGNSIFNNQLQRQQETKEGCLCLEEVAKNMTSPLLARHSGDGSGRVFVAEQKGVVYILYPKTRTRLSVPFLNISSRVKTSSRAGDERGFLGLAFHPRFSENGRFFVYYSTALTDNDELTASELAQGVDTLDHKTRISEMKISDSNPNVADDSYEKIILEINEPYSNHNGGELLFLDDGYLYIFVGDGGGGGDPFNLAQNRNSLLGKILRIDVDSNPDRPYTVPNDNPFVHRPDTRPEIFALGVRNIWRCGVDKGERKTGKGRGRVVCGDVGQNAFEELNILKKGANYGWRSREGFECYDEEMCGAIGEEELPIFSYPHSVGKSVTGGHFYRGCENPGLSGLYIYGDYMNGRLFSLKEVEGHWENSELTMCGSDICFNGLTNDYDIYLLSFGEDEDGEVYMLTDPSWPRRQVNAGKVFKFVDPQRRGNPDDCPSAKRRGRNPVTQFGTREQADGRLQSPVIEGINIRVCGSASPFLCHVLRQQNNGEQ